MQKGSGSCCQTSGASKFTLWDSRDQCDWSGVPGANYVRHGVWDPTPPVRQGFHNQRHRLRAQSLLVPLSDRVPPIEAPEYRSGSRGPRDCLQSHGSLRHEAGSRRCRRGRDEFCGGVSTGPSCPTPQTSISNEGTSVISACANAREPSACPRRGGCARWHSAELRNQLVAEYRFETRYAVRGPRSWGSHRISDEASLIRRRSGSQLAGL